MSGPERSLVSARTFVADWDRWRDERRAEVLGPVSPAGLVARGAVGPRPRPVDGTSGRWHVDGDAIVGVELAGSAWRTGDGTAVGPSVRLGPGEYVTDGRIAIRARLGAEGAEIRVHECGRAVRLGLVGVLTYPPEPRWALAAEFRLVGGAPAVVFLLDGASVALDVGITRAGLDTAFVDAGRGRQHHAHRRLRLPMPDQDGRTLVDFNRSTLPASAFTSLLDDAPPAGNRLDAVVSAGERMPHRRG